MTLATIILAIMASLALVVSLLALWQSHKANTFSREANDLSKSANRVAEQAREDATDAPIKAERRRDHLMIRDQLLKMHDAITQAWVHDQSRPLGPPPDWYQGAIGQVRAAYRELPTGDLATLLAPALMHHDSLYSSWRRLDEAEQKHYTLESKVHTADTNEATHEQTDLVYAKWNLSNEKTAVMTHKEEIDRTMSALLSELKGLLYPKE